MHRPSDLPSLTTGSPDRVVTMSAEKEHAPNLCPTCNGTGLSRNSKHFFYGISLVAAGMMCFFQWPPAPSLFKAIWQTTTVLGLSPWTGSALIWGLTGIPPLFGLGFLYSFFTQDTCPVCRGHGKASRLAVGVGK